MLAVLAYCRILRPLFETFVALEGIEPRGSTPSSRGRRNVTASEKRDTKVGETVCTRTRKLLLVQTCESLPTSSLILFGRNTIEEKNSPKLNGPTRPDGRLRVYTPNIKSSSELNPERLFRISTIKLLLIEWSRTRTPFPV